MNNKPRIPPAPITAIDVDILHCLPLFPDIAPAGEIAEDVGLVATPQEVAKSIARLRKNGMVIMSSICAYQGRPTTGYGVSRLSWAAAKDCKPGTKINL